jgi:hypothetical protein
VMQRYRECHDLYHCITSMPVRVEYEIVVKAFEFANLGLPMTGLAAVGAPFKLSAARRDKAETVHPMGAQVRRECEKSDNGLLGEAVGPRYRRVEEGAWHLGPARGCLGETAEGVATPRSARVGTTMHRTGKRGASG